MADAKITDLASASTLHADDWLMQVDTHDTTMHSSGTNKRLAPSVLAAALTLAESQVTGLVADLAAKEPAIAGGTSAQFWRGDKTWVTPPAASTSPGGSDTQLQYNGAGSFAGASSLTIGSSGQLRYGAIAAPGSPADGDTWYDSAALAPVSQRKGLSAASVGLLYSQTANVTVTTNSATTMLSATGAYGTLTLPAGFLNVVGKTLRIKGGGYFSTAAASPGNLTWGLKLGSNVVATNPSGSGQTANLSNMKWSFDIIVTTKTAGASGKLDISGVVTTFNSGTTTFAWYIGNGTAIGTMAAQTQITLDLTAAYAIDWQIFVTNTGNSYTLTNFTVEALN